MEFGQRLRQIRKEKGLTQSELAKVFGLGESTISFYEAGKREPDFKLLKKIAKYFNVTTDWLLGLTDEKNPYETQKVIETTQKPEEDICLDNIQIAAHDEGDEFKEAPEGLKKLIKQIILEVREEQEKKK